MSYSANRERSVLCLCLFVITVFVALKPGVGLAQAVTSASTKQPLSSTPLLKSNVSTIVIPTTKTVTPSAAPTEKTVTQTTALAGKTVTASTPGVKQGSVSSNSTTTTPHPLLIDTSKTVFERFGSNLAQLLPSFNTQSACSAQYSYCVNQCLGHPPKAAPDKLITACESAIDLTQRFFNHTYRYEFCEAKQYFCRYGQCDTDNNCPPSDSECQAQISKVVTSLGCQLSDAQKTCEDASSG
jgi:hypothetical protein